MYFVLYFSILNIILEWIPALFIKILYKLFTFKRYFTILHIVLHAIPDINPEVFISPLLFHCFVRVLFRTAIALHYLAAMLRQCCPCQLWPVPQLAPSWSQRTAASPRRSCGCHHVINLLLFHLDDLRRLECEGSRIAQSTLRTLLFLFSTFSSPSSLSVACSLCRDSEDLFFFDLVVELLESRRSSVALQTAMPFASSSARFFFLEIDWSYYHLSVSSSLLCFRHPPLLLHFNVWPLC